MANEAIKAIQWERAKGELRAFVALVGSEPSEGRNPYESEHYVRWKKAGIQVERFIRAFENDGLQE